MGIISCNYNSNDEIIITDGELKSSLKKFKNVIKKCVKNLKNNQLITFFYPSIFEPTYEVRLSIDQKVIDRKLLQKLNEYLNDLYLKNENKRYINAMTDYIENRHTYPSGYYIFIGKDGSLRQLYKKELSDDDYDTDIRGTFWKVNHEFGFNELSAIFP